MYVVRGAVTENCCHGLGLSLGHPIIAGSWILCFSSWPPAPPRGSSCSPCQPIIYSPISRLVYWLILSYKCSNRAYELQLYSVEHLKCLPTEMGQQVVHVARMCSSMHRAQHVHLISSMLRRHCLATAQCCVCSYSFILFLSVNVVIIIV